MMSNAKHDNMINFCLQQTELSRCKDKKTAAILVRDDMTQIYSIGINGGPANGIDCLCQEEQTPSKKKYSCVHAEQNCLVKAIVRDAAPKIMICSKQPCAVCASLIINSHNNIIEVWFVEDYWDNTGLKILSETGIYVARLIEYEQGKWCFK